MTHKLEYVGELKNKVENLIKSRVLWAYVGWIREKSCTKKSQAGVSLRVEVVKSCSIESPRLKIDRLSLQVAISELTVLASLWYLMTKQ
jgi:hypothetical protein